jgi:hypothetical protein
MEYNKFLEDVKQCVAWKIGGNYTVQLNHVIKNNAVELDGIVIFEEGGKISPNIYLNSFYEQRKSGITIEKIAEEIVHIYYSSMRNKKTEEFPVQFSFEELKPCIIYRLVNYSKNKNILCDMPHIRFLDLAITFHCLVKQDEEGIGTIRITNELLEKWEVMLKDLFKIAHRNTPKLFPVQIRTMNEVIREIVQKEMAEPELSADELLEDIFNDMQNKKDMQMYILSNSKGINGASTLLYEDVVQNFANQIDSDFYVLPSSIHELILVPYHQSMEKETLRSMVCDVNQTQVPQEEILSDQVYLYRRESNSFE